MARIVVFAYDREAFERIKERCDRYGHETLQISAGPNFPIEDATHTYRGEHGDAAIVCIDQDEPHAVEIHVKLVDDDVRAMLIDTGRLYWEVELMDQLLLRHL